jgi:hypothetical protein
VERQRPERFIADAGEPLQAQDELEGCSTDLFEAPLDANRQERLVTFIGSEKMRPASQAAQRLTRPEEPA